MTRTADRAPMGRALAVAASVIAAIAVPVWQFQTRFGLSAAAFSATGDTTLAAAPWTFAIWGVIYAWLIAYAAYLLWPRQETPRLRALAWPSVIPILGCAAWIVAAALNARWPSVVIIVVSAAVMIAALLRACRSPGGRMEAGFTVWPLALLAGWLTTAGALGLLTVMTAEGIIRPAASLPYALGGIGVVTALAVLVQRKLTAPTYALAIAWGLTGVVAAEWGAAPLKALAAGVGAVIALVSTLALRAKAD